MARSSTTARNTKKPAARPAGKIAAPKKQLKNNAVKVKPVAAKKQAVKTPAKNTVKKPDNKLKSNVKQPVKAVKAAVPAAKKPILVKVAPPSNQNVVAVNNMTKKTPVVSTANVRPVINQGNSPFQSRTSVSMGSSAPRTPFSGRPIVMPTEPAKMKYEFKAGDHVVYPAHGVGQIESVETQTIAGLTISVYAIVFEKDRMRLKVPVMKAESSGLRKISSGDRLRDALKTLKGRAKIRRVMWSRRAQEYEMKINSGDPVAIAEVLRDLKRSNDDSEQSYSERQIYQSAMERLAREVAVVNKITEDQATLQIEQSMGVKQAKTAVA